MRLFLPQTTLETWVLEEKADFKDGQLTIVGSDQCHPLVPAVHFTRLVSGADAGVSELRELASLETLDVTGTEVTPEALKRLRLRQSGSE